MRSRFLFQRRAMRFISPDLLKENIINLSSYDQVETRYIKSTGISFDPGILVSCKYFLSIVRIF
jgi:hypothetical protein